MDNFKYKHTPDDADALAAEMIPENFAAGLGESNWKTRDRKGVGEGNREVCPLEQQTQGHEFAVVRVILLGELSHVDHLRLNLRLRRDVVARAVGVLIFLLDRCCLPP